MSEHFIKEIEIKNFKCFEDFKAEGFGRVNLIGGKNNVGKTAFMEACFLSQSDNTEKLFGKLLEIKTHRDVINNLLSSNSREEDLRKLIKENIGIEIYIKGKIRDELKEEKDSSGNILAQDYSCWTDGLIKIESSKKLNIYTKYTRMNVEPALHIEGEEIYPSYPDRYNLSTLVDLLDINFDMTKKRFSSNFISPYSNSDKELENIIGQSKLDDKYDELNEYLLEVFNVSSIDFIKNKPMLKSNGKYRELSHFGQGIKTFINIISAILLLKDDIIFIDEIENGLHHSNLDKLWNIILILAKERNVQVFATTHSNECIRALVTANTEDVKTYQPKEPILKDNEIKFIELGRTDETIKAIVYDFESLQEQVHQNQEIRGW